MKQHKILNTTSIVIYAICFIWSLLYFWVFAGPTGLLSMIVWQYLNLFILCPLILTAIHVAVKRLQKETCIIMLSFVILNVLNYILTWNMLWFSQGRGLIKHLDDVATAFLLTLPAILVGLVIGIAIWGIKKQIKSKKDIQIKEAP